jgi:hypothetical protein
MCPKKQQKTMKNHKPEWMNKKPSSKSCHIRHGEHKDIFSPNLLPFLVVDFVFQINSIMQLRELLLG